MTSFVVLFIQISLNNLLSDERPALGGSRIIKRSDETAIRVSVIDQFTR